ncbi:MAG: hypothetical protein AMJ69_03740 [Gammaproteobacteria bacterium SG8_47]|nr:MAG: hypothetical protein AMJ69_03740 [Gammaproteobacteria bacterium SG8_47]
MIRKATTALGLMAISALSGFSIDAHAEEAEPDKFKLAVGGYTLGRYTSTVSVTDPDVGGGVSLDPQDTLGLETEQTVLRLDGYYRFNPRHSLTYSWYRITSDGNKNVEQEFDWVDDDGNQITIPVGARVDTRLTYNILKVGYLWSFYHSDKVELAFGGGLHSTQLKIQLQAETTSSGLDARDVKTTVPLPVLSFRLGYHVTPKLHWYLSSEAFALAFDEWSGSYTDSTLALEYRAWRNVGLGLGLGSNALEVNRDSNEYNLRYNNRVTGILAYVAGYF